MTDREIRFREMEAYATDLRKAEERVAKAELDVARVTQEYNQAVFDKNNAQRGFDCAVKAWRATLVDRTPALALTERKQR